MASTTSNPKFGDAYSSVQANNIGSVHIGLDNTLDRLPRAEDAPFNALAKQHEPACLPDTRVALLDEIHSWADGTDGRCVFWLSGLAGTGKSTIARTVARRYGDRQRLAASFFFSRGGGDVGHVGKFVTSIAVQLAQNVPAARQHINHAVAERSDVASQSLHSQWQHLILHPLSKLHKSEQELETYIIVVDALDECGSHNNINFIVQLLAKVRPSLIGVRLRVFLTSRPEVPIRHGFGQIGDTKHKDVVLHDISPSIVDHDIATYLEHNFRIIAKECYQHADWPGAEVIRLLVHRACGLFIWAATACFFVREGLFPDERLRTLVEGSTSSDVAAPEEQLNEIYTTVLRTSVQSGYSAHEITMYYSMLRSILGSIVVLASPLSTVSLGTLLWIPRQKINQILKDLHAFLSIPEDSAKPLRLHHPSFRDFLLNKDRCRDANFRVDEINAHEKLSSCCLQLMSATGGLQQDMCSLSQPGTLRSEIGEETVASSLPPELQYACRYWVEHVERSQQTIVDGDAVHVFLQTHLLHWLEAMSLIGETDQCVRLLARLQALVALSASKCADFLRDANRFVLRFSSILAEAPLQVYSSALIFAPETSVVQKTFIGQVPQAVQIVLGRDAEWDACRSVLEGHTSFVNAVAFSTDGQLLASASHDSTVRVWETATGVCRSVLEGHTDGVNAVVFSVDGQLLASASHDRTVRVWETATGACRSMLEDHTDDVNAVVFSADGQFLASASHDETVRVWETATGTGACRSMLDSHTAGVNAVVFSADGQLLASASYDETVRVWETATGTGACRSVLEGHTASVNAVVFSADGQLLASASHDKTVRVWETATGACRTVLESQSPFIYYLTFSLDGRVLRTDKGDIPLPLDLYSASSLKEEEQSSLLIVEEQWVLHSTQRLLWLPFKYQTHRTAVYKDTVCVGCISGRVALLRLR